MGYNTQFKGELKFIVEPTVPMIAKLNSIFGADPREHPEWNAGRDSGYIDLMLNKDFTGIKWDNGCEKTYYLEKSVNIVLEQMRKEWPEFGLSGSMLAQGEDIEDRWELYIGEDGLAHKRDVPLIGAQITCPHCRHKFIHQSPVNGSTSNEVKP